MVRLSGTGHGLVSRIQSEHSTVQRRSLQGVARGQSLQDGPTTCMNTPDILQFIPEIPPWCRHTMLKPLDWITRQVLHGFNKMASTIYLGHDLISPGAACGGEWSWRTRPPASAHAPGSYSWHPASLNPASLPSGSFHTASRHPGSLNPESWQTAQVCCGIMRC